MCVFHSLYSMCTHQMRILLHTDYSEKSPRKHKVFGGFLYAEKLREAEQRIEVALLTGAFYNKITMRGSICSSMVM